MQANLEPEQEELLTALVEASRGRPRDDRTFDLWSIDQGDFIGGVGAEGALPALADDIETLDRRGLVKITNRGKSGGLTFYVTTAALEDEEASKRRPGGPVEQVAQEMQSIMAGTKFRSLYAVALERWGEAVDRLWGVDAQRELTTVGLKCREAMQGFATALVARHAPEEPPPNSAHTVARVRAVLDMHRSRLSGKHADFLDAVLAYWGTASDLVQRQTHGAEREEELTWEDGWRVVFQTAVVMIELHRALEPFFQPSRGGDV